MYIFVHIAHRLFSPEFVWWIDAEGRPFVFVYMSCFLREIEISALPSRFSKSDLLNCLCAPLRSCPVNDVHVKGDRNDVQEISSSHTNLARSPLPSSPFQDCAHTAWRLVSRSLQGPIARCQQPFQKDQE